MGTQESVHLKCFLDDSGAESSYMKTSNDLSDIPKAKSITEISELKSYHSMVTQISPYFTILVKGNIHSFIQVSTCSLNSQTTAGNHINTHTQLSSFAQAHTFCTDICSGQTQLIHFHLHKSGNCGSLAFQKKKNGSSKFKKSEGGRTFQHSQLPDNLEKWKAKTNDNNNKEEWRSWCKMIASSHMATSGPWALGYVRDVQRGTPDLEETKPR